MSTIADTLKLDRKDLRGWPEESIKTILKMQKDGWRAVKNRTGHITLYAPDSVTTIVASRSGRGSQYLVEDLRRYENNQPILPRKDDESSKTSQKWPCPRPGCQKFFIDDEKLSIHMAVDHDNMLMCPEDGCSALFKRPNQVGLHRRHRHGYVSPNYKPKAKKQPTVTKEKPTVEEVKVEPIVTPVVHVEQITEEKVEVVVEEQDGAWGYTETVRPMVPTGARSLTLTDDILNMDVRTLLTVFKAAGMDVSINVADRSE